MNIDASTILSKIISEDELKYCNNRIDFECLAEYYRILDYLLIAQAYVYAKGFSLEHRACIVKDALNKLAGLINDETAKAIIHNVLNDIETFGECKEYLNSAVADKIRKIVWNGTIPEDDDFKNLEFHLYVIDFPSIQSYVYSSGSRLLDVQGASIIVDAVCKLLGNYIREKLGREYLIQEDAGEVVVIFPSSISDTGIKIIEEYLDSNNLFRLIHMRTNRFHIIRAKLAEIYDPKNGFFGKLYRAALSLIDFPLINNSTDTYDLSRDVAPHELCQVCRNEEAIEYKKDQLLKNVFNDLLNNNEIINNATTERGISRIGRECLTKSLYALIYRKLFSNTPVGDVSSLGIDKTLVYRFQRLLNEYLKNEGIEVERFPNDLDDYNYVLNGRTRNAYIALVHGDGDEFGTKKIRAKTITRFRLLSLIYKFVMTYSLYSAIMKAINTHYDVFHKYLADALQTAPVYYYPVLITYYGGDDFTVIGRAEIIMSFLNGFYAGLEKLYTSKDKVLEKFRYLLKEVEINKITVSIAISIGKTKTPIFLLYEASQALLRHIKESGKNISGSYGIKADFILFRGAFSKSYMNKIIDASKTLGPEGLIVMINGNYQLNYIDYLKKMIGCDEDGGSFKYPLISPSDLAEYVELGFEGEATGEWLLLKIAYDASRLAEDSKYEFYKELVEQLWNNRNSEVWVIILKLLDLLTIYQNPISFYQSALSDERISNQMWKEICRQK